MGHMGFLEYFAPVFNLLNTIANLYWSNKLKGVQLNKELLQEKDELIKDLHRSKNEYKRQYVTLLTKYKHLEGRIAVYERFHRHVDAEPQKST